MVTLHAIPPKEPARRPMPDTLPNTDHLLHFTAFGIGVGALAQLSLVIIVKIILDVNVL